MSISHSLFSYSTAIQLHVSNRHFDSRHCPPSDISPYCHDTTIRPANTSQIVGGNAHNSSSVSSAPAQIQSHCAHPVGRAAIHFARRHGSDLHIACRFNNLSGLQCFLHIHRALSGGLIVTRSKTQAKLPTITDTSCSPFLAQVTSTQTFDVQLRQYMGMGYVQSK